MFELMLMRHAKSDWHSHVADIDRPLNKRGREDALRMGEYLDQKNLVPDTMVVSSAQRTQETANLLLNKLRVPEKHIIVDKALYLADMETLCDTIELYASDGQRLLILAHNPGMDYLVSYLASKSPSLTASGKLMTSCALAHFVVDSFAALKKSGQAELQNLLRPKEIMSLK